MKKYILSIDAGTTSSRAILFDKNGKQISISQFEFTQIFPKESWVEHDAIEIWETQLKAIKDVVKKSGIHPNEIDSIGITNQRETTVVWNKNTGKPVYNAIVWQDRRTAFLCKELENKGLEKLFYEKTGLVLDAYFSGTKIKWILDNVPKAKQLMNKKQLLFGTIDSFLIWRLTRGKIHATDATNASRTMIYNISSNKWDDTILNLLKIKKHRLWRMFLFQSMYMKLLVSVTRKITLTQQAQWDICYKASFPPLLVLFCLMVMMSQLSILNIFVQI